MANAPLQSKHSNVDSLTLHQYRSHSVHHSVHHSLQMPRPIFALVFRRRNISPATVPEQSLIPLRVAVFNDLACIFMTPAIRNYSDVDVTSRNNFPE